MGHFYTNFSALESDRPKIIGVLKAMERRAFFAADREWCTIYDEETESQYHDSIQQLGQQLSQHLQSPVLGVLNHEDDVLEYWLFDRGIVLDHYNSWPGCYGQKGGQRPIGGNSSLLCELFGLPALADEIHGVLHEKKFVFAFERHIELAQILGLDPDLATIGFLDIRRSDISEGAKAKITVAGNWENIPGSRAEPGSRST
jgi:hypothetical protein